MSVLENVCYYSICVNVYVSAHECVCMHAYMYACVGCLCVCVCLAACVQKFDFIV